MKPDIFNELLRTFIKKLLNDGHTKFQICSLTFGAQSCPQLEKFIDGIDLGVKPISRLLNNMGYDLHLVAVPKEDNDTSNQLTEIDKLFFEAMKYLVAERLDNLENTPRTRKGRTSIIDSEISKFTEAILQGEDPLKFIKEKFTKEDSNEE